MTKTAKYYISERDYLDSQILFNKLNLKAKIAFMLAFGLFLASLYFFSEMMRFTLIGGFLGGIVVVVILRFVVIPTQGRRQYQKYKAIQEEFEIELAEDGLKMATANGHWLAKWDQLLKWRENEQFILMMPMSRIYYIVPKHVASQGFNIDELRQKLITHIGSAY